MGGTGKLSPSALSIVDGRLEVRPLRLPPPLLDQVCVEVAGAGVNRADLLQVRGLYPAPPGWPADIPGLEFAGRVGEAGPEVRSLAPGDRVFGIVGGGAQATHVLTTESLCARVPPGIDLVAAGAVPEAFVTAHDALAQAGLQAGERLLIHAVGSGVGTAAVQIARAMGATTVGTSRTEEKLERAEVLGLDDGVLARGDMTDTAARIGQVDVVLDLVGGEYLGIDVEACRTGGRIIVVGVMAGARTRIDLGAVMRKRLTVRGTVLRTRPEHAKAAATETFRRSVVPLFCRGLCAPVVDEVIPLERAADAYELVRSGRTFGKVVLTPEG